MIGYKNYAVWSAIKQQVVSVGTSATKLPTTPLTNRRVLIIQNLSTTPVYIGSSTVTADAAATGGLMLANQYDTLQLDIEAGVDVYGRVSTGTANVAVFEGR